MLNKSAISILAAGMAAMESSPPSRRPLERVSFGTAKRRQQPGDTLAKKAARKVIGACHYTKGGI